MTRVTLWHNPRCSKSRAALALLTDAGAEVTIRLYLDDAPSRDELVAAQDLLNCPVIGMMRPCEPAFRDMALTRETHADTLMQAMAQNPKLIERPIAFADGKAIIGRPPEAVLDLI
ncbi:arsenate reductase (glutaredoxin) [Puniceibacterium sediminis]|uniref:Arsenate reductase n=1 Tax=Puniceibacterium sediminis TaxID=1608407 RepID=A0A238VHF9_9RHOB|nr:arsenate reductase (glutaredoxin) [Puniceibacterium sediminis]SNR33604.1 arsenate reductase [Puniceibacterium sediminis]